jgi:superkiller protein 3
MIKRFFIENGKEGIEEIDISEILENNKKLLQSTLNSYALNQFKIQEKELKAKNLSRREGPTTISTGKAIYNFIEAVINRKETTTGIPYQLNNKWFFVNLPVTFLKGYPELDYNKFKKLTEEDKEQLNMRIIGKGKRSLEKILNKTIKGKNLFEIPKDTEILDGIFNSSIRVILKNKIYSKQKDKEENNLSEKELTSKLSLEHYDKGIKFFDEKDYDNANISSRKALNLERKEKYWSLFSDSFFNSEKKNPQSLIHFLNYQESIDNSDSNLFHNKGLVFMSMKDYDNAIISYEKSLNLNPDSIWGHYDLGNCKIEIRDYHEAKKILLKGMAKDKEKKFEFLFRHKIGVSYYHQRLYDEAISNFKIEVGLNPESGWGFHDLALCYFELKNKPEFLYHANKALELKTVSKEWIDQKVKFLK